MQKKYLLLPPLLVGMILMLYSWRLSYPLSIDSPLDFLFNHISPLYWLSLPLLLASLYMLATTSKNNVSRWVSVLGIVMSMRSLTYFYYLIPGSDSHYFRGLTEYFIATGDLDPTKLFHSYFQWPSFFVLNKVLSSLLGLRLVYCEFLLYTIFGVLFVTSLYIYASKVYRSGYVAVLAFFIIDAYFFNWQWAPFSLAFGLLLLLFMLETHVAWKREVTLAILTIFTGMSFMHVFVPLFFILYTTLMYIIDRNKRYAKLFLLTLIIYLTVQVSYAEAFFSTYFPVLTDIHLSTYDFGSVYKQTISGVVAAPLDAAAQMFSRAVVIATGVISGVGFIILLIRRKLRLVDRTIFLTGVIYVATGFLISILGTRAIPIMAFPVSLGASYLFDSKFRSYFKYLFLILLILFTFIPLHSSHYLAITGRMQFQSREAYQFTNFVVNHCNWSKHSFILSSTPDMNYLETRTAGHVNFESLASPSFPRKLEVYDYIVYSIGLEKNLLGRNSTIRSMFQNNKFNLVYNSGLSCLAIRDS